MIDGPLGLGVLGVLRASDFSDFSESSEFSEDSVGLMLNLKKTTCYGYYREGLSG